MGYYIQVPANKNKARQIEQLFDGVIVNKPKSFSDVPEDKALIIVVDNGPFEAAGYVFNEREFEAFTDPDDPRPHSYILMDKAKAQQLSGYNR